MSSCLQISRVFYDLEDDQFKNQGGISSGIVRPNESLIDRVKFANNDSAFPFNNNASFNLVGFSQSFIITS